MYLKCFPSSIDSIDAKTQRLSLLLVGDFFRGEVGEFETSFLSTCIHFTIVLFEQSRHKCQELGCLEVPRGAYTTDFCLLVPAAASRSAGNSESRPRED
jgi:hypothetical protein